MTGGDHSIGMTTTTIVNPTAKNGDKGDHSIGTTTTIIVIPTSKY